MHLIVGLGNPGEKYKNTRHNIGFMTIDKIKEAMNFDEFKSEQKFKAAITKGEWQNKKIILVKPLTFMNLSGETVQLIANFFKIKSEKTVVIYDDIDLPLEKLRIREEGSPGTHNGMKSITQHIGQNFPRIRIGIESRGATSPEQINLHDFVLGQFNKKESLLLPKIIEKASNSAKTIILKGTKEAMNQFN